MDLKDLFDLHEKLETRINASDLLVYSGVCSGGWLFSGKLGLLPLEAKRVSLGVMVVFLQPCGIVASNKTGAWNTG